MREFSINVRQPARRGDRERHHGSQRPGPDDPQTSSSEDRKAFEELGVLPEDIGTLG